MAAPPPPPLGMKKSPGNWKDKPKPPPDPVSLWQVDPSSEGFQTADVSSVNLDDVNFYSRIEGGSGGVFILNSQSCGVFVAKSAGQVFQEIYALELGNCINSFFEEAYQFHLPTTVVYSRDSENFNKVISVLNLLEPKRTAGLGMDSIKITRLAQQNHIELMEFVLGTTFRYLSMEQAHIAFTNSSTFHRLASVILFDVLLNNYDRVPLPVWSNDGNPKNVLVNLTPNEHKLNAIDQCVTAINDEDGLKTYCDKVRLLVANCFEDSFGHLESVRLWIKSFTGYSLTDSNLIELNNALRVVIKALSTKYHEKILEEKIREHLASVETKTRQIMGEMVKEIDDVFKVNMFLNREFILLIWETIRDKVYEISS